MQVAFRAFPDAGIVAMFDEPNQTGDVHDIDAPRNAPAKTPEDHLDKIYFHSSLNLLEVAMEATVTINHASVAAGGSVSGSASQSVAFAWAGAVADNLLLDISSLGLSDAPLVMVSTGDNMVWPGMPVQTDSGGRARYITAYSTATAVRLWESASKTGAVLAAASIDYKVIVFRPPAGDLNDLLMGFDPVTGEFQAGRGRFSTTKRYLQVAPGGSPVGIPLGRTIDLDDGAPRAVRPDGTAYDPVPATATVTITPGTGAVSASLDYSGTFAGSDTLEVQAPGGTGSGPKGFTVDPVSAKMTFHGGGATDTLVVPDSIPVVLLPEVEAVTDHNAVFSDFSKDWMNTHQWNIASVHGPGSEVGFRFRTVVPQEPTPSVSTLLTGPDGADIFVGQIKLTRTVAPTHNWISSPISKLVPEDVWISVIGGTSLFLEAHLGVARAMSLFLDDGDLVLHQQQSVGPAPGGFGTFGEGEPGSIFSVTPFTNRNGGETVYDGQPGWPMYSQGFQITGIPESELDMGGGNYRVPAKTRRGGVNAPSFSDPTNYSSTWQFDLRGQFGRRS